MSIPKKAGADLRKRYPIHVQLGFIAALGFLIVAFRANWSPHDDFKIVMPNQEQINVEEIPPTDQVDEPPPPPKPRVPIVVPNNEVLEEDELDFGAEPELDNLIPDHPPSTDKEPPEDPEMEVFVVVEEMPEPLGGMRAIYERASDYPEMARKAGLEGRVIVQFLVDVEGNVHDPKVLRGVGAGLDELAVEAIRNTKFKPGMQRGKPVPVKMNLSILFKLK